MRDGVLLRRRQLRGADLQPRRDEQRVVPEAVLARGRVADPARHAPVPDEALAVGGDHGQRADEPGGAALGGHPVELGEQERARSAQAERGVVLASADVAAALAECPGTSMQLSGLAESLMGRECRAHPTDISVCHGVAGELMALMSASRTLRSRRLSSEAERRWHLLFNRVRHEGYRGGSPGTAGQVGLMAGLSGLAMAGLMMVDSDLAPVYFQRWTKPEVQR